MSVDQKERVGLSTLSSPHADVQYLYQPSYDSLEEGVEGQDYVVVGAGGGVVLFALCDGVGQSFFGQLAAKFLGDTLLDWLGTLEPVVEQRAVADRLTALLTGLTAAGQRQVESYTLPADLAPLVRAAWEDQRDYGSETMFVCGRLHFGSGIGDAGARGQCVLCWLGDSEIQVFDHDGAPLDLGADWSSDERWSTRQGIKGAKAAHVWTCDLHRIGQIVAYSDGLDRVKDCLIHLVSDPDALRHEITQLYNSPQSDDISLVSISPRRLSPPMLLEIDNRWLLGSYTLRWQPVSGAEAYVVEEALSLIHI